MTRATIRLVLCGALVCLTAGAAQAQTTTSSSETKKFQVISVDGNVLVVKLPEGTREMAVADDFRFNVDGKMLSVHELKPGMAGKRDDHHEDDHHARRRDRSEERNGDAEHGHEHPRSHRRAA